MIIVNAIAHLQQQRDKIDAAIRSLQALGSQAQPAAVELSSVRPESPKKKYIKWPKGLKEKADAKSRTEKACNACDVIKPLGAFASNSGCVDGHAGTCKACTYDRVKRNKAKGPNEPVAAVANAPRLDGKHECPECHALFMGPAQLREHRQLRHAG